jgi:hypothetical protein
MTAATLGQMLNSTPWPVAGPSGALLPARISLAPAAPAQTYYVDPSIGNDANTVAQAKSPATPWASIQHALDTIPIPSAGANTPVLLYLRGTDGTTTRGITITDDGPASATPTGYKQVSTTVSYQSTSSLIFPVDSPLTISNYPGERVLLSMSFHLSKCAYVAFRGTNVGTKKGLVFDPRFPNNITTLSALKSIGSSHLEFFNCEVRNAVWNGLGAGIYVGAFGTPDNLSSLDIQIINCYVHHCGGQAQGGHGIYYGGTTNNVVGAVNGAVYNNVVVYNMDDNISPHNSAHGTIFSHNLCAGWGGGGAAGGSASTPDTGGFSRSFTSGLEYFTAAGDQTSVDTVVSGNLLVRNKIYGLHVFDDNTAPVGANNVELTNLYHLNGTAPTHQGSTADPTKFKFLSTLLNNNPLLAYWSNTVPPASGSAFKPTGITSPAYNAADARYCPSFDFDGNTRATADIGPYAIT